MGRQTNLMGDAMGTTEQLTDEQRELVAQYYTDALKIGNSFKSSVLYDDEKETIAVKALMRAAKQYDKFHKSQAAFSTYLYRSIFNSLISAGRHLRKDGTYEIQKKRFPQANLILESTIEARAAEHGKVSNLSTLLAAPEEVDAVEFQNMMERVQANLTEKQRFILNLLMTPGNTLEFVAKKLKVSRQRVHQQLKDIREVVKANMKQEERV